MPRLLGVDYGRARIGVAVCDELGITTRAVGHIPRENDTQAAAILAHLARQEKVEGVVFGKPLHAHGDSGENVQWVEAFIAVFSEKCELPVYLVDERYTSSEAEEELRAEGQWPVKPGVLDARAAGVILKRYLNGEE